MPRTHKPLKRTCLGLGLLLAACNVFNPSGEGDAGGSVDAQLTEGENFFRAQNYSAALESFESAIKADSSNSLAYYGYAKAVMRKYNVNASSMLTEVSKAQAGTGVPFIGAGDAAITNYLQATSRARKALNSLTLRDTLTKWYYYTLDSNSKAALKDPLRLKRIAAMEKYWATAELAGAKGFYKKSQFPLSDLKMGYEKIIADFGFIELIYAITHLRDLNGDNIINSKDNLLKSLTFSTGGGGFKVENLAAIADSLKNDTVGQQQLNALIQNVSSGLGSASKVLDLLGPALTGMIPGGDSASGSPDLSQKVSQNMDSVITSLGNAVTFYQFGDKKDNDGDGCIDEEILDGKDNDADGFIDEDARIIPDDLVDNDHNGKINDPFTKLDPDEVFATGGTTLPYTVKPSWVIGALYKDKATRISTQMDSLDVRTPSELKGFYKSKLDVAKAKIGGCWNNY